VTTMVTKSSENANNYHPSVRGLLLAMLKWTGGDLNSHIGTDYSGLASSGDITVIVSSQFLFLFSFLGELDSKAQVWQEMNYMDWKIVNCPHCGKILPKDLLKGKDSATRKIVKCPQCGSTKNWKDAKHHTPTGAIQRYYCRDCGLRFSEP